jgi:thiamine transport system substrate-binding protein
MKSKPALVLSLLLAPLIGGCFAPTDQECTDPPQVTRPARFDGQTLTILDQGAFSYMFEAIEGPFEAATGADLRVIDGGDAGTALRTALLSAGNPPADLLFGIDNALFFAEGVRERCLYLPYESPQLVNIDARVVDVDLFRVDGRLWTTPVDHAYVSVNYDIRLDDPANGSQGPTSLEDLATARWAPSFVTPDPRFSSPGLLFLLTTVDKFGESGPYTWKHYWRDLLENGGLVTKDWTSAYVYHFTGGYGQYDASSFVGGRQVVVSYTTSPAVEVFFGSPGQPSVSLEPPGGVIAQFETLGILRGTKNQALAEAFIDFALTPTFQRENAPNMATYPVLKDISIPDEFTELATDPSELALADLDGATIAANLDHWIDEWVEIYRLHLS